MLKDLLELRRQQADLRLSASALETLVDRRLRALVRHCCDRVPYYRSLLDEAGVEPVQIRSVSDLERIPVSSKRDLRQAGEASLISRGVDLDECWHEFTSGSTGEPFKVYFSDGGVFNLQAGNKKVQIGGFQSPRGELGKITDLNPDWFQKAPTAGGPAVNSRRDKADTLGLAGGLGEGGVDDQRVAVFH